MPLLEADPRRRVGAKLMATSWGRGREQVHPLGVSNTDHEVPSRTLRDCVRVEREASL